MTGKADNDGLQRFSAMLTARGPAGAWTFLTVPFSVEAVWGTRARVAVSGTINGYPFRNSLMPEGDGSHSMMVSRELQRGARAAAGDSVAVEMRVDTLPREVSIPDELLKALEQHQAAARIFETLAYSHRKEYADWVGSAKKAETRLERARKAIPMVLAKKHR